MLCQFPLGEDLICNDHYIVIIFSYHSHIMISVNIGYHHEYEEQHIALEFVIQLIIERTHI